MGRNRPFRSSRRRAWRKELFAAQDGLCHWCKQPMLLVLPDGRTKPTRDYATFEHLIPHSAGGKWSQKNIVLACWECNETRADSLEAPRLSA